MRILVTGGFGFVGRHLIKSLAKQKPEHEVVVFDSLLNSKVANLSELGNRCVFMQHTVCNYDAISRAMQGVGLVYHLAARMDWSDIPQHAAKVFHANAHGTVEVLTAARAAGVPKVIFTSSAAVYGCVVPGIEDDACFPVSVYGWSKLAAEAACQAFTQLGLEVVILRLFNVYGEGGHGVYDLFRNGTDTVHGDGSQTRDFVHVDDVVRALTAAYKWEPGVYNIGTGAETTILGLWRLLHDYTEPKFVPAPAQMVYRSFADTSKTVRLWQPRTFLTEGVNERR